MAQTLSDIFDDQGATPRGDVVMALHVVVRANDPLQPPSRHLLDGIDVVRFARGDRGAVRGTRDGLRQLTLTIPDPMMSSEHGRLVHARGRWLLDDPRSKNGAIVDGRRTRSAVLAPGTAFALGHTVFLLDQLELAPSAPRDLLATDLRPPLPELATFHPGFQAAIDVIARVAETELPVLLLGETGTGKEVLARALHELSRRRGAFVPVNCGAIASSLVESELFGHRKGAFSGAVADRPGHVRSADRGTLFLDEIAEMPLVAQTAFLRVLQEREVVPVGDSLPIAVELRVCAATHRDLPAMVGAGSFRDDLYARLMGATVRVPPLRERRADLGLLIKLLLLRQPGGQRARLTPAAALALMTHAWPRNVRELERALAVAATLAGKDPIDLGHLPETVRPSGGVAPSPIAAAPSPAAEPAVLTAEDAALKQELLRLLDEHGGNLAEVARALGKDRTQLYRWVRRLGIERVRGRDVT